MATPDDQVILYPAGGCFNRLRSEQTYLNALLRASFSGWERAENKKNFVITNILNKIPGGVWIYDRETGRPVRPDKKDAENRILQVCILGMNDKDHSSHLRLPLLDLIQSIRKCAISRKVYIELVTFLN